MTCYFGLNEHVGNYLRGATSAGKVKVEATCLLFTWRSLNVHFLQPRPWVQHVWCNSHLLQYWTKAWVSHLINSPSLKSMNQRHLSIMSVCFSSLNEISSNRSRHVVQLFHALIPQRQAGGQVCRGHEQRTRPIWVLISALTNDPTSPLTELVTSFIRRRLIKPPFCKNWRRNLIFSLV